MPMPGEAGLELTGQHPGHPRRTASPICCGHAGEGTVAAQALRRAPAGGADSGPAPLRTGTLRVLLSGRLAGLPDAALRYPEGRLLARLPAGPPPGDRRPVGA
jgi:glutamate racemase